MSTPTFSRPSAPPYPAESPAADASGRSGVVARAVDFQELASTAAGPGSGTLDRLLDVSVTVTAELGRASLSIGDVLKLAVGSVLELDRPLTEPVDLMVQGVRLARGEVVVVDDRFAIRIKEITEPRKGGSP